MDVLCICRVSGPPLVYKGRPWGVARAATGIQGDWQGWKHYMDFSKAKPMHHLYNVSEGRRIVLFFFFKPLDHKGLELCPYILGSQ